MDRILQKKNILVDYENIQTIDVSKLDASFKLTIFLGATQKMIPVNLIIDAEKAGVEIKWMKLPIAGKNALDFLITYQLGRIFGETFNPYCIIISKDTGFDPLLKYLTKQGLSCQRAEDLTSIFPNISITTESLQNQV